MFSYYKTEYFLNERFNGPYWTFREHFFFSLFVYLLNLFLDTNRYWTGNKILINAC